MTSVVKLKCEHRVNPLGIDNPRPRLSWQMLDDRRGASQSARQVQVAENTKDLKDENKLLWDSGKVESDESHLVPYDGPALTSRQHCVWRVRVWDQEGEQSEWSDIAEWEMGLLEKSDWQAEWIGPGKRPENAEFCPLLRKEFSINSITSARLYITARGLYDAEINGQHVGNDCLVPGWTDFNKRLQVLTYDVTDIVTSGENAIGIILGDGWYSGRISQRHKNEGPLYGDTPELMAQIEIQSADGSMKTVSTDASWTFNLGPIEASDIYDGETYNAEKEIADWSKPGCSSGEWSPVVVGEKGEEIFDAKCVEPVRRIQELNALEVTDPEKGKYVFDFGQNMVGWVRTRLELKSGQKITLRFGEMLQADGTLYTENLRDALCTDYYTAAGDGLVEWEPRFTFHGFRYAEVSGIDYEPALDALTGIVLHNDMEMTGSFECSHPLVNQLQSNIQWGQRGNFLEVPTDCPQRNERLGWTGDAQIFVRTASFNMDVAAFFEKWMRDLSDEQGPNGAVPSVIPSKSWAEDTHDAGPAWSDAAAICPWTIYKCYGDLKILEDNYETIKKYVEGLKERSHDLIRADELYVDWGGFGDWLSLDAPGTERRGGTPTDLIGTAYFALDTRILADIARILGKNDEAEQYTKLARYITEAFQREFVTPNGRVAQNNQTAYLLALGFDMLPDDHRPLAVRRLVNLIERANRHLKTGFVGTPLLCPVLSSVRRHDLAVDLLLQETYPSWLYTVLQGATTMWERWNSYTIEDGFGDVSMNSFNHYAYGSIGAWMVTTLAGLDTFEQSPGHKRLKFAPRMDARFEFVKAKLETPYGLASSEWKIADGVVTYDVTVPPNTSAKMILPGISPENINEGAQNVSECLGISALEFSEEITTMNLSAGQYTLTWPYSD